MFSGWELAFGLGALALLLTLAYGVYEGRRASPTADRLGEEGAKRIYDNPAESDRPPKGGPRRKAPPLAWIMSGLLVAWLVLIFTMGDEVDNRPGRTTASPPATQQSPS